MGITITERDLQRNPRLRAAIDAEVARSGYTKPQRNRRGALVREGQIAQGMVDIAGPLVVRITRYHAGEEYDDDNFSGGCKQLRDAIAAALSRRGDSTKDGLRWEYRQIASAKTEIVIEIFREEMRQ